MYVKTENLIVRQFCLSDFDDFLSVIQDKMASEWSVYDEQFPTYEASVRDILHYFSQSSEFMAIELIQENRVIGFVSLNIIREGVDNLGFCIHSCYQHKGYASEAVKCVIEYARNQLSVKKLVSGTAYITSNLPKTQILDPNPGGTVNPDWSGTPKLTPMPVEFASQTALAGLSITWKRKDGAGREATLTTVEAVSGGILTVSENRRAGVTSAY